MGKVSYINDSIHGLISISEYEKKIISSVGFNRLHDVYQNSTVYLTFPANRTKRFEHSIGTMKLCSDMFYSSILNASDEDLETFYKIFEKEYENILNEISENSEICEYKLRGEGTFELPDISLDKFRHSLIPNNVPLDYKKIHLFLIESIRVAALLHDIGHPPFSHVVEYALKEVYEKNIMSSNEAQTERMKNFLEKMKKYFGEGKKLHEEMGDEISKSILKSLIKNIDSKSDKTDANIDENLHEILIMITVEKIFSNNENFEKLHKIIDSTLDGDRLDYVTRDSLNSGMNVGKIDYNRIINDMKLIIDSGEIFFCVPLKTVNSIEDFIKRRYHIYKDIIHHHRVIKTDFLLEEVVKKMVELYLNEKTTIKPKNSPLIPFDISGLWFPLGNLTTGAKANALSQWNDSWLMTVLKQIYYKDFYSKKFSGKDENENKEKYVLEMMLAELLRNEKAYYSFIKRGENFKTIDDEVKKVLISAKTNIEDLLNKLNNISVEKVKEEKITTVDIKASLDFIEGIMNNINNEFNGFLLSFISRKYKAINIPSFKDFIEETVELVTNEVFKNIPFHRIIVPFKNISQGIKEPIYFYDENNKIYGLNEISGVSDILKLDSEYLPVFYTYVIVEEGHKITREFRKKYLREIGNKIGENIINQVKIFLESKINQIEESFKGGGTN